MEWIKQSHQRSLFGQLLIDKKLISEQQLQDAIDHQRKTGERLGDIFAAWNIITHREIQSMLRKQRTLRLTATIATALLAPMQAYAAVAPVPVVETTTQTSSAPQGQSNWRALTEQELSEISGQGIVEDTLGDWLNLSRHFTDSLATQTIVDGHLNLVRPQATGLQVLGDLAKLMNPLLLLLDANITIKDVVYDPVNSAAVINKDGSITLRMPSSIGEISFKNIRVRGSTGPSFGSIDIKGIDLRGTTVTLTSH